MAASSSRDLPQVSSEEGDIKVGGESSLSMDEEILIPGLSNDVAILCLVRLSRAVIPIARSVCSAWKQLLDSDEYPLLRKEAGKAEGWIYVLPEHPSGNIFKAFNPKLNKWYDLPRLPGFGDGSESLASSWEGFSCVAVEDMLFIMGGIYRYPDSRTGVVTGIMKIYHSRLNKWLEGVSMMTPRSWFAAASIGKRIYVAGGQGRTGFLSTCEFYDVEMNAWFTAPNMACVRSSCRGIAYEGRFWVLGGEFERHQHGLRPVKGSAEVYDAKSGKWVLVREMCVDIHKVPWPCTIQEGKLLTLYRDRIMSYDVDQNRWEDMGKTWASMPYGTAFESVGGCVFGIGGLAFIASRPMMSKNLSSVHSSNLSRSGLCSVTWKKCADIPGASGHHHHPFHRCTNKLVRSMEKCIR
ncbi:F-box/kelch-repeat protein At1g16250 [Amborella trichopoda]|uniref:F-box/kelch-repeat protein At1g16250 n=1 Tax=Amborella trichopoda TaxID=13333 RepID=UPI0009C12E97|nr:F-box/kelch-repeat protein At1g16250 [Amborella trichopoda]|eukprot:XP_006850985.2 F-box/kelch-repeat protein At1g16250 [Amborella trichopoda]